MQVQEQEFRYACLMQKMREMQISRNKEEKLLKERQILMDGEKYISMMKKRGIINKTIGRIEYQLTEYYWLSDETKNEMKEQCDILSNEDKELSKYTFEYVESFNQPEIRHLQNEQWPLLFGFRDLLRSDMELTKCIFEEASIPDLTISDILAVYEKKLEGQK